MKKRGSVLTTVLIVSTILLILGTAISAAVINTTKLNKKYSDNIDLELAAKSGLNIIKDDFISRVNKKEIKTLNNIKEYTENINKLSEEFSVNLKSNSDFHEIKKFFEGYLKENIVLNIKLKVNDSNKLEIQSIAKDKGNKNAQKEESQVLVLNFNDGGESGGSGDLSGIINQDAVLIIPNQNSITAMDHINNGIIVVDEKKKYNNYNTSSGLHNPIGTIDSDINISIPKLNINNPIKQSNVFYLTSNGISYNFNFQTQDYYKMEVYGEYQINNNYNDFIVVTINGDLTIQGNQNAHNINKNIIYVVNGNVSLTSNNDMIMQGTTIMANKVKNIGSTKVAFNSGLVITNEIYLPNGYINQLSRRREAITIIDSIIKGASI